MVVVYKYVSELKYCKVFLRIILFNESRCRISRGLTKLILKLVTGVWLYYFKIIFSHFVYRLTGIGWCIFTKRDIYDDLWTFFTQIKTAFCSLWCKSLYLTHSVSKSAWLGIGLIGSSDLPELLPTTTAATFLSFKYKDNIHLLHVQVMIWWYDTFAQSRLRLI